MTREEQMALCAQRLASPAREEFLAMSNEARQHALELWTKIHEWLNIPLEPGSVTMIRQLKLLERLTEEQMAFHDHKLHLASEAGKRAWAFWRAQPKAEKEPRERTPYVSRKVKRRLARLRANSRAKARRLARDHAQFPQMAQELTQHKFFEQPFSPTRVIKNQTEYFRNSLPTIDCAYAFFEFLKERGALVRTTTLAPRSVHFLWALNKEKLQSLSFSNEASDTPAPDTN